MISFQFVKNITPMNSYIALWYGKQIDVLYIFYKAISETVGG